MSVNTFVYYFFKLFFQKLISINQTDNFEAPTTQLLEDNDDHLVDSAGNLRHAGLISARYVARPKNQHPIPVAPQQASGR